MCVSVKAKRVSAGCAASPRNAGSRQAAAKMKCFMRPTFSNEDPTRSREPPMRRIVQHPLLCCLPLFAFLMVLVCVPLPAADEGPKVDPATFKTYAETIPGSKVKFDMVATPGGKYQGGSPAGEKGREDEEGPQHEVAIRPFWMGKCEVTWDEFDLWWKDMPGSKDEQIQGEKRLEEKKI